MLTYEKIMDRLRAWANPMNVAGMAKFGICSENTLGVSMKPLRELAKSLGKNHTLALELWGSCIHEARILATLIDDPALVTDEQGEAWVVGFNSWDICDQCCINLFRKTTWAFEKAEAWSGRSEEYVKRAGFALMATLAVHEKKREDAPFESFLNLIKREAGDERNFVKKAINWALRQIGKKNAHLQKRALQTAEEILLMDSPAARWVARDALRELGQHTLRDREK